MQGRNAHASVPVDSRIGNLGEREYAELDGDTEDDKQLTRNGQVCTNILVLKVGRLLINLRQIRYAIELLVLPAVGFNKISVLLLYKRIFVTSAFQRLVWWSIGFVVAWIIAFEFAAMRTSFSIFIVTGY